MTDSPALAAQSLLDMLPDGCELETATKPDGPGWKATARIHHVSDSPRPCYVGRGPSEDAALLEAIRSCGQYWESRERPGASVISGWRV